MSSSSSAAAASVGTGEGESPHRPGRIRVGVRCRPFFDDEISGETLDAGAPCVTCSPGSSDLWAVNVRLSTSRSRDFVFDEAFDSQCTQDNVYDRMARPVVSDVLRGYNGTVFAYGQTGTGKTYTMGILNHLDGEAAGIVPRSLSHLFSELRETNMSISMSFLQIYNNLLQDLLVNTDATSRRAAPLALRENPGAGFYVDGLSEFNVTSFEESLSLVNFGLQNRAIAATMMNVTSSRSHTVLTVHVRQVESASRTLTSKLLLVDLAGSERVRRTTSQGARLSEAKAINTSLSVLGNVISALSQPTTTHVPFRDSKLTRILQGSLGGTSNTAVIATVGPSGSNRSETLSTLQFASRCMRVTATPIQHAEVDYVALCNSMQTQIADMESQFRTRAEEHQARYETVIRSLALQLRELRQEGGPPSVLDMSSSRVEASQYKAGDASPEVGRGPMRELYEALWESTNRALRVLQMDKKEQASQLQALDQIGPLPQNERTFEEQDAMALHDPLREELGPHLPRAATAAAMEHALARHPANSIDSPSIPGGEFNLRKFPLDGPVDEAAFSRHLKLLLDFHVKYSVALETLLHSKDKSFKKVRKELVEHTREASRHQEEVLNWSYVLKYLLETNSSLRSTGASTNEHHAGKNFQQPDIRIPSRTSGSPAIGGTSLGGMHLPGAVGHMKPLKRESGWPKLRLPQGRQIEMNAQEQNKAKNIKEFATAVEESGFCDVESVSAEDHSEQRDSFASVSSDEGETLVNQLESLGHQPILE